MLKPHPDLIKLLLNRMQAALTVLKVQKGAETSHNGQRTEMTPRTSLITVLRLRTDVGGPALAFEQKVLKLSLTLDGN